MAEKLIGKVTHYFTAIGVGAIKLKGKIKIGDILHFKGKTTDFEQRIVSLQYNHQDVKEAGAGQEVGLKTDQRVREGDNVFLVLKTSEKKEQEKGKTKKIKKPKKRTFAKRQSKKKVVRKKKIVRKKKSNSKKNSSKKIRKRRK